MIFIIQLFIMICFFGQGMANIEELKLNTSDFCPTFPSCNNQTHIYCLLNKNSQLNQMLNSSCKFQPNVSLTENQETLIVDFFNSVREKAMEEKELKFNQRIVSTGPYEVAWDDHLAAFAQITANTCQFESSSQYCFSTYRFPNPSRLMGRLKYTHPDWLPPNVTNSGEFTKGFSTKVINHSIMALADKWTKSKATYSKLVSQNLTHIGCGVSAYYVRSKNTNQVLLICYLSHGPDVIQPRDSVVNHNEHLANALGFSPDPVFLPMTTQHTLKMQRSNTFLVTNEETTTMKISTPAELTSSISDFSVTTTGMQNSHTSKIQNKSFQQKRHCSALKILLIPLAFHKASGNLTKAYKKTEKSITKWKSKNNGGIVKEMSIKDIFGGFEKRGKNVIDEAIQTNNHKISFNVPAIQGSKFKNIKIQLPFSIFSNLTEVPKLSVEMIDYKPQIVKVIDELPEKGNQKHYLEATNQKNLTTLTMDDFDNSTDSNLRSIINIHFLLKRGERFDRRKLKKEKRKKCKKEKKKSNKNLLLSKLLNHLKKNENVRRSKINSGKHSARLHKKVGRSISSLPLVLAVYTHPLDRKRKSGMSYNVDDSSGSKYILESNEYLNDKQPLK